jgi:type IV pilus assembly protein PilP
MKTISRTMLAAGLLLGALGCEDAPSKPATPAPARPAAAKADEAAATAPAADAPVYVYAYNPTGKRDPFRAPEPDARNPLDLVNDACTEPLCQFDIGSLTLVAVVTGGPNPLAMVEDPEGRGFIVRRNSRIGRQGGKVSAIRRDEVTITEFWTGPDGKVVPNAVTMKLRADEERAKDLNLVTGMPF